ncbi:MAG: PASTA domain-containing protein [Actinobacteria bacterium]|nr:PASTA domain-containing protein [Actinomycetota bacterium]
MDRAAFRRLAAAASVAAAVVLPSLLGSQPAAARPVHLMALQGVNGCGPAGAGWVVPDAPVEQFGWLQGVSPISGNVEEPVSGALAGAISSFMDGDITDTFTPACNQHDRCWGTLGVLQNQCDSLFWSDLEKACRREYLNPGSLKWWMTIWESPKYLTCSTLNTTVYRVSVGLAGREADLYRNAQQHTRDRQACNSSTTQSLISGMHISGDSLHQVWGGDCGVVDATFGGPDDQTGNGWWMAIARHDYTPLGPSTGWNGQVHLVRSSADDLDAAIGQYRGQGFVVTDVEYGKAVAYGGDAWQAVLTSGTGWHDAIGGTAHDPEGLDEWLEAALYLDQAVTEIEEGDGTWFMQAHAGTGIGSQVVEFERSLGDLASSISTGGYQIQLLEYVESLDSWLIVWAEFEDDRWEESGIDLATSDGAFFRVVETAIGAGREIHDIEYGDGVWVAAWHRTRTREPVPPCTGRPAQDVSVEVAEHFTFDLEYLESDTEPAGTVASCDPPEGTMLEPGSLVTIVIYAEPEPVEVPWLYGMTPGEADEYLRIYHPRLGGVYVAGTDSYDTGMGPNEIFDQEPDPGDWVQPGTRIGVWIYVPAVPVADLVGFWHTNTYYGVNGSLAQLEDSGGGQYRWTTGEGFEDGMIWEDGGDRLCAEWDSYHDGHRSACGTMIWWQGQVVQIEWDDGMWFWREGYDPECPLGSICVEF